ncbi:hypothetical protein MMC2321_02909 [Chitinophaga sp. MM2321]
MNGFTLFPKSKYHPSSEVITELGSIYTDLVQAECDFEKGKDAQLSTWLLNIKLIELATRIATLHGKLTKRKYILTTDVYIPAMGYFNFIIALGILYRLLLMLARKSTLLPHIQHIINQSVGLVS